MENKLRLFVYNENYFLLFIVSYSKTLEIDSRFNYENDHKGFELSCFCVNCLLITVL